MEVTVGLPTARERIVIALRDPIFIDKGTLSHVLQIPIAFLRQEEVSLFPGLDLLLNEILLNHRRSELDVYLLGENSFGPGRPVPIPRNMEAYVEGHVAGLRFVGIPVAIKVMTKWDDVVSQESQFLKGA